jgi:hypothetical protein
MYQSSSSTGFLGVCSRRLPIMACFPGSFERTLQWATAVAVFFLPKHCTLWGVDMIAASFFLLSREKSTVVRVGRMSVVVVVLGVWDPLETSSFGCVALHRKIVEGLCPGVLVALVLFRRIRLPTLSAFVD